jgi:hypothetical protein
MERSKLETFVGVGLVLIVVLAFLLSVFLQLPKSSDVSKQAQTLPEIPRDLFASDNAITNTIRQLNTPTNVPVTANPENLGRSNVFENF